MSSTGYIRRTKEFERLQTYLDKSKIGSTQLCFVVGESGSGKTVLVDDFTNYALEQDENLVVAVGRCKAHIGEGIPLLPFQELIEGLLGNIKEKKESYNKNSRLQKIAAFSLKTLIDQSPELLGTLVPYSSLVADGIKFIAKESGLQSKLESILGENSLRPKTIEQDQLFQEYSNLLEKISKENTLIIVMEDLQWADSASLNLFLYLAQKIKNSNILMIGTYRPNDVTLANKDNRHPLTSIVNEFKRYYGDIWINLDKISDSEKKLFVSNLIDLEPNKLSSSFRETLYQHTKGQALFVVELLKDLKERGYIYKDQQGYWLESQEMDWNIIPTKVEGIIEERIGRLEETLYDILSVASVQGHNFAVKIIAKIQQSQENTSEQALLKCLSRELEKQHQLVEEADTKKIGKEWLTHYKFSNMLFQQYMYNRLPRGMRIALHSEVAKYLEEVYKQNIELISAELAYHYENAGEFGKARQFYYQAAKNALLVCAYSEAIINLKKCIVMLDEIPSDEKDIGLEIDIYISLRNAKQAIEGWESSEINELNNRISQLYEAKTRKDYTEKDVHDKFRLWIQQFLGSRLKDAYKTAEECLEISRNLETLGEGDREVKIKAAKVQSLINIGTICYWTGNFTKVCQYIEEALQNHSADIQKVHIEEYGYDTKVIALMYSALTCCACGDIEKVLKLKAELDTYIKNNEEVHPFSTAIAIQVCTYINFELRNIKDTLLSANALVNISEKFKLPFYLNIGTMYKGWALCMQDNIDEGITIIQYEFKNYITTTITDTNRGFFYPSYSMLMADVYLKSGRYKVGIDVLDECIENISYLDSYCYTAEIYRLKGQMLEGEGNSSEAEEMLRQAIDIARKQKAKYYELRSVVALFPILQKSGKESEAKAMLADIYNTFPQDLSTYDLLTAKELMNKYLK